MKDQAIGVKSVESQFSQYLRFLNATQPTQNQGQKAGAASKTDLKVKKRTETEKKRKNWLRF